MTTVPPPTPEEVEDLRQRLDELCQRADTRALEAALSEQAHHALYMASDFGRWTSQVEMYLGALKETSDGLNYLDKSDWPPHRGLQFVIAAHALKPLYSGYGLLLRGCYEDAITLLRSVYESFLRILFISCNQDHPYNAYNVEKAGAQFNATGLVDDELKLDWRKYRIMSMFTHSNKARFLSDVVAFSKGESYAITVTYEVNEDYRGVGTNNLDFLVLVWLRLFNSVFRPEVKKSGPAVQRRYETLDGYSDIAFESLSKHTANEYWRCVARDVEKLFELIDHMDQSPDDDWKKYWTSINPARMKPADA
jgi:hypothetical protein